MKRFMSVILILSIVVTLGCSSNKTTVKNNDGIREKFTITFLNGEEVLQKTEYEKGKMPKYLGETPIKETDGIKAYTFIGWDKEITPAFRDATYVAQFSEKEMGNRFVDLKEIYYPYSDTIKRYLENDYNVENYRVETAGYKGIKIEFESTYIGSTGINFYYSLNEDFSDSICINLSSDKTYVELFNLLKDKTYYIKLTNVVDGMEVGEIVDSFKTTSLGPRPIKVDGIDNVRDLGGYQTKYGRTIENMLFRGSEMNGPHNLALTEKGQETMSEILGIKLDLDLRGDQEAEYITKSPINSAKYLRYPISSYDDIFYNVNTKNTYREIFRELSNIDNYPIYYHCWGGADRTGTLSFMLNALLGVSEKELINDYEYTTFSSFGLRSKVQGAAGQRFYEFLEEFHNLIGETPKDKATSYFKSIGVTDLEINEFIRIMYGNSNVPYINAPIEYNTLFDSELVLTLTSGDVKEVTLNGTIVPFTFKDGTITISDSNLSSIEGGNVIGKVALMDGTILDFSFLYKKIECIDIKDIGVNERVEINTLTTLDHVIGYDKYVRVRINTETNQNGGVYMLIGSYGFLLRGGLFRFINMNESGTIKDLRVGPAADYNLFNKEKELYLKINLTDTTVGFDIYVLDNEVVKHYTYECNDAKLDSGEIRVEDAKVTFYKNETDVIRLYIS